MFFFFLEALPSPCPFRPRDLERPLDFLSWFPFFRPLLLPSGRSRRRTRLRREATKATKHNGWNASRSLPLLAFSRPRPRDLSFSPAAFPSPSPPPSPLAIAREKKARINELDHDYNYLHSQSIKETKKYSLALSFSLTRRGKNTSTAPALSSSSRRSPAELDHLHLPVRQHPRRRQLRASLGADVQGDRRVGAGGPAPAQPLGELGSVELRGPDRGSGLLGVAGGERGYVDPGLCEACGEGYGGLATLRLLLSRRRRRRRRRWSRM